MTRAWPSVPLGEVLQQYTEYIEAPEPRTYPKLSVKLYGRGVTLDAPTDGTTLRMKRHQLAKAGQVILSEIWGKKGAIGIVPPEGDGALCTSHFFLFDINRDKLESGYLQAIFTANYLEPQLGAEAKGTTGYAAVRPKTLLAATIPLPPLPEQRRSVARVVQLAARVERVQEHLAHAPVAVRDLGQSVLAAAFSGKLTVGWRDTHPDIESAEILLERIDAERHRLVSSGTAAGLRAPAWVNPGDALRFLPATWSCVQLERICACIADIDHNMPKAVDEGVKFLSVKDLQDDGTLNMTSGIKRISEADYLRLSRKIRPRRDDIIYSRIGARLGKARLVQTDERFLVSYSCCVVRPLIVEPRYVALYLDSDMALQMARAHTQSIGVPDLGLEQIAGFAVPLPPVAEQTRIVTELDTLQAKLDELKRLQAETQKELDAMMPSILDRAFKGEL